jgi:hypothetical protein
MLTLDDIRMVSPALAKYAQGAAMNDLWQRPDAAPNQSPTGARDGPAGRDVEV